ncbi:unnamed protein product [Dicrocoelium dendriticum]|nr:unnamed protein product [Dicrocoelium dendriticum]
MEMSLLFLLTLAITTVVSYEPPDLYRIRDELTISVHPPPLDHTVNYRIRGQQGEEEIIRKFIYKNQQR